MRLRHRAAAAGCVAAQMKLRTVYVGGTDIPDATSTLQRPVTWDPVLEDEVSLCIGLYYKS